MVLWFSHLGGTRKIPQVFSFSREGRLPPQVCLEPVPARASCGIHQECAWEGRGGEGRRSEARPSPGGIGEQGPGREV